MVVVSVCRPVLPAADVKTAPSLLWFATIQGIEGKQDPAGLAPKGCFIPTEAIEREVGQISETQKATRKVSSGIDAGSTEFGPEPGTTSVLFVMPCDVGSKLTGPVRPNSV